MDTTKIDGCAISFGIRVRAKSRLVVCLSHTGLTIARQMAREML